ncbi:MAG: hypothetical protein H0U74_20000 [Bradymonadaceae bacterium]|nr:hypothetical protein [Lujinxingiaceae bacterium]
MPGTRFAFVLAIVSIVCLGLSACQSCEQNEPVSTRFFEPYETGEYVFDGAPALEAPRRIMFGDAAPDQIVERAIRVRNVGRLPLRLERWELTAHFSAQTLPASSSPPEPILPGQSLTLVVRLTAPSQEAIRGRLILHSNDPHQPEFPIELFANEALPCLSLAPADVLDFGRTELDTTVPGIVEAHNCSPNAATTLRLERLEGDAAFALHAPALYDEIILAPGQSTLIELAYSPVNPGPALGRLHITTNDTFENPRAVELRGVATGSTCLGATPWQMHPGAGVICFGRSFEHHGAPEAYAYGAVPHPDASAWADVANNRISFNAPSRLCNTDCACLNGGDFTYFQTFFTYRPGDDVRSLHLGVYDVDDGVRVNIYNELRPQGTTVSYAYLFDDTRVELAQHLAPGTNRIVLTHLDDCCQDRAIRRVELSHNGQPAAICAPE